MVGFNIKKWLKERNIDYKNQKEEIKKARQFYDDRQHDKVEQIINQLLLKDTIQEDIRISCLILQSGLLYRNGTDFKKCFEIASSASELAEKYKDPLLLIEAHLATISSLIDQGATDTITELFRKVDKLFNDSSAITSSNLYLKSKYYSTKGLYYGHMGKIDLALENYLKSAEIEERIGRINDLIASLNNVGLCYSLKGEVQKSIDCLNNVIDTIEQSGEESKYEHILATTYGNLGTEYSEQGELEKGLEYLKKSLSLSIATSNFDNKAITLANIGDTYRRMSGYIEAINYYKRALDLFIQTGNQIFEIMLLVALLSTYVLLNDEQNKKEYMDKITSKFNEHKNDELFKTHYMFSKALLLKESTRLADRVEAQKLFKEISNKEEIYIYVSQESILYYLELLLEELKYSPSESLMDEITQVNEKLKVLAKNKGSYVLIVESMLIEAKINILNLNFDTARHLLTQAQITAEEKGLKQLSHKISREHDSLLVKMNQLENIVNDSASIKERIELANFDEVIRSMILKSYKVIDEEQEHGLILLIVNSAGLSMFSRKFSQGEQVEDQIVASLLTAINSFSQETFKTKESLERIKLGDNIVIIKSLGEINICYAYRGPSYHANNKVNDFASKIESNEQLLVKLQKFSTFLPEEPIQMLNTLVDDVFIE